MALLSWVQDYEEILSSDSRPSSACTTLSEAQFMEDYGWERRSPVLPDSFYDSESEAESVEDEWRGQFVMLPIFEQNNAVFDENEYEFMLPSNVWINNFLAFHVDPENEPFVLGDASLLDLPDQNRNKILKRMNVLDLILFAQCGAEAREIVRQEGARRFGSEMIIKLGTDDRKIIMKLGNRTTTWIFLSGGWHSVRSFRNYEIINVNGKRLIWDKANSRPGVVLFRTENLFKYAGALVYELLFLFPNTILTSVMFHVASFHAPETFFKVEGLDCQKLAIYSYADFDSTRQIEIVLDNFRVEKTIVLNCSSLRDGFTHAKLGSVEHVIFNMGHWVTGNTIMAFNAANEVNIDTHTWSRNYKLLVPKDFNIFIKNWLNEGSPNLEHFRVKFHKHPQDEAADRKTILEGIECLPVDMIKRESHYRKTRFGRCPVDCGNGVDIMKEDGTLATVVYGCPCSRPSCRHAFEFNFIVWRDRSQPAVENTSRMTEFEIENENIYVQIPNW